MPTDPLSELQPLIEPVAIGWWPLAWGWWVVIALLMVAVFVLARRWQYKRRANRYRVQALNELALLPTTDLAGLLKLLRRTARSAGMADIAALPTSRLLAQLELATPQNLDHLLYRGDNPTTETTELIQLRQAIARWIRRHSRPPSAFSPSPGPSPAQPRQGASVC